MSLSCIARSLAIVLFSGPVAAGAAAPGLPVQVLEAYTAPTKPKQKSAEVYARFVNVETDDRLAAADSALCQRVELVAGDGSRRPYGEFQFKEDFETGFREGAPHLHLVGLKRPLVHGESFQVTLHFEAGGTLELDVKVE